ncbi:MAG TPA: Rho termination factor N-terminal domain-containing protein [Capillimicrobium sp.]|nr:Rho termination factor N-terminal domain-containing protein [Capillimicrobium sp.]
MAVLDRASLEESPLADLHAIARELGIDGFRRLRKAALIDAIVERQGGDGAAPAAAEAADAEAEEKPKRRTRTRRRRKDEDADEAVAEVAETPEEGATDEDAGEERPARARRSRSRTKAREEEAEAPSADGERVVEGTLELLGNGSGFVRLNPPEPSDDDVYISAAQIRRCELVSGDKVGGPVRPPRRSERYPSLIRVDTINGRPADEVAEGTPFDELPAAFPTQRFSLGGEDPTLKAIEWLTPIGRGSRVTIVGAPRAGKSEALKRLAGALAGQDGLEVSVVLTGARPEEIGEWKQGPVEPAAALSFAASADAQAAALERAIDTAKRIAARGGDAVVLVDSLSGVPAGAARRALAAARDIVDGGSLTVIAVADQPLGGETTVIALDAALTSTGRFPAVDLVASGTLRPELLVGEAGADAIAQARAAALG